MHDNNNRIGFVLASIHTGASQRIWPSFAKTALREDKSLFIFPGGRLNTLTDSEYLRNPVYSLVNSENLDGCISWSSTIKYTETEEEFIRFHSGFDPLHYVTLSYKISGHPCVEFDSYNGMKQLTSHFINVHKAKKIAFIRGPDFNRAALARLEGFKDAHRETGLTPDNLLITDSFNWDRGDAAAAFLFENRMLKPGVDFDTLIGSSDLMILGAVNYFAKQGYHIPGDYHAAGFNNSVESRLTESPLTTVHIPYSALSAESLRILMKLSGKKKNKNTEDIKLPVEIIIRESCGCEGPAEKKIKAAENTENKNDAEKLLISMIADFFKLDAEDANAFIAPVVNSLFDIPIRNNYAHFFKLMEKVIVRFFDSGRDTELFFDLINRISESGLVPPLLVQKLSLKIFRMTVKIREQLTFHSQYENEFRNKALNSLKCELLGTRDRNSLLQSLARHLVKIGINIAGIALYRDDKTTLWAGSFSSEGISPVREQPFPARLLVPHSLKQEFSRGVFMVQPLFIENKSLGYFVHNVPVYDGIILEELRSTISYALKGIFQFEELTRTKQIAQQAERAKTEFLRALESNLYDPLAGVIEKIEELENAAGTEIKKNLKQLKTFVASREEHAVNLIDLALSGIDDHVLTKTLFDPQELLSLIEPAKENISFPLLLGDKLKLSQCFSIIKEEYSGGISASVEYGGLEIIFQSGQGNKKKIIKEQTLLLCERIILLHGGVFKRSRQNCSVTIPWPGLTGKEIKIRSRERQDHVLLLTDYTIPACLRDLPAIRGEIKTPQSGGNTAFIICGGKDAGSEELLALSSMEHKGNFRESAVLCYGKEFSGNESVIDAAKKLLKSPGRTVLFIGGEKRDTECYAKLSGDKVYIPSISAFNETVTTINPRIIICNSVNTQGISEIRKHPITVTVPVIMIEKKINSASDIMALSRFSGLVICHRSAAFSIEFQSRLQDILDSAEKSNQRILPPHTGSLVKKTILYFDQNVRSLITRRQLADAINVNEDYLTRIFHKEMGLSLWNYLNRLKVYTAQEMLLQTDESIQEIALYLGFQDYAYFCRLFKKIYGLPPGQLRKQEKKSE